MPTKDEPPFREALVKNADVVTIASQLDPMATVGWNLRQKEVDELRAENERLRATVDRLCDESQHAIQQGNRLCACRRVTLG